MQRRRVKRAVTPLIGAALSLACLTPGFSQNSPETAPLSVIDWLGTQKPLQGATPDLPSISEPPVAKTGRSPVVKVTRLGAGQPREIGLVPPELTGLPADLWAGSDADTIIARIAALPDLHLPAAQSLLYTVLLAETQAPRQDVAGGDRLALARVTKLMELGALDPALSLIEQAGVTTSTDHFDLWMQISLLTGTEDRACAELMLAPYLTRDYGTRIFCAARAGKWENAALTFGSAQALGLLPKEKLNLLDRFLNPDFFEGASPLQVPRKMDPLSFRLFESIGERLPTGNLPRAYAVADLRDLAGWKSQLEAAERLTRAGALPDNHLLGLYTERKAAASGGIWDRVVALQRFETALRTSSAEAVTKTLPPVWAAMQQASLETAFAALFADQLTVFKLEGQADRIAFEIGMLSASYERAAAQIQPSPDIALLRAIAMGETTTSRPQESLSAALFDGFKNAAPRAELISGARNKRLGESILVLLRMLEEGLQGDAVALRDAVATLRALGLEDTARRAALQTLLLDR